MNPDFSLRPILEAHPNGVSINELMVKTRLPHKKIKTELDRLPVVFDGEYYHLYQNPEQKAILQAQIAQSSLANKRQTTQTATQETVQKTPKETVQKTPKPAPKRNKPFTPNPIMGYQVQKGKAKIFLDRRASSKTLTLSLDDLKELVMAVEKVQRI